MQVLDMLMDWVNDPSSSDTKVWIAATRSIDILAFCTGKRVGLPWEGREVWENEDGYEQMTPTGRRWLTFEEEGVDPVMLVMVDNGDDNIRDVARRIIYYVVGYCDGAGYGDEHVASMPAFGCSPAVNPPAVNVQ